MSGCLVGLSQWLCSPCEDGLLVDWLRGMDGCLPGEDGRLGDGLCRMDEIRGLVVGIVRQKVQNRVMWLYVAREFITAHPETTIDTNPNQEGAKTCFSIIHNNKFIRLDGLLWWWGLHCVELDTHPHQEGDHCYASVRKWLMYSDRMHPLMPCRIIPMVVSSL